jgi:hypothetical protein
MTLAVEPVAGARPLGGDPEPWPPGLPEPPQPAATTASTSTPAIAEIHVIENDRRRSVGCDTCSVWSRCPGVLVISFSSVSGKRSPNVVRRSR